MHWLLAQVGNILGGVNPEWFVVAGGCAAFLWRLEHRLTRIETKVEGLAEKKK